MAAATRPVPESFDEGAWARELVTRIVRECPRRVAGGEHERRAHEIVRAEFEAMGLATEVRPFRWNESTYANMALHFGLGVLGTVVAGRAPLVGAALHAGAAASYLADSARLGFALRRLFPFRDSQNVVATLPSRKTPRLRLVFLAHVDAAFTGFMFRPSFVRTFASKPSSPLYKSLRVATASLGAAAALDVAQKVFGTSRALTLARLALTVPSLLAFLFNLDVVLRHETVPGATDDLSGVAGMMLLARRLRGRVPDDVELVFVATGCEEAGLGGAQALADEMKHRWDRARTVVVGLDGLCNGALGWFTEGEILPVPLSRWLRETLREVAASDPKFAEVRAFEIPVGGTDAIPFASLGFDAVTLGCVDRDLGAPRHYHVPSDTPENLEPEKITFCVDFAERLFDAIVERR